MSIANAEKASSLKDNMTRPHLPFILHSVMRSKLCLLFIYSHQNFTFLSVTGDSIFYNCMNPFLFQLHSGQLLWFSHTVNEMTDHTVSTCIRPVILRFQSRICQMIAAEIWSHPMDNKHPHFQTGSRHTTLSLSHNIFPVHNTGGVPLLPHL